MPLQHLDEGVLKRMKRPFASVNSADLVARLRAAVPGIALRTTMIVGFPGETPAEHQRMLDLVRELEFDRLGAFQYSKEEDTPAGQMAAQVPKRTRERRWNAVMAAQAEISARLNARRVGRRERVLIESFDPHRKAWAGRSAAEAPEIDGKVYVTGENLKPGEFRDVAINTSDTYDLFSEIVTSVQ
jgi:ribosomal protein S12 methylthiotransferase